jgi:hypothetical protein
MDTILECKKCNSNNIRFKRIPYCGPGNMDYLDYKCHNCGHHWDRPIPHDQETKHIDEL